MTKADRQEFAQILQQLFATFEMPWNADAAGLWWAAMQDITLDQFRRGCAQYAMTGTNRPRPAHVRELVGANDRRGGYPSPVDAWAHVPKSEGEGGWVCQPMMDALHAVLPAINAGDMVAARADYQRLYAEYVARASEPARWWYSGPSGLGYEQGLEAKRIATEHARKLGWISDERANRVLGHVTEQGQTPALLTASGSGATRNAPALPSSTTRPTSMSSRLAGLRAALIETGARAAGTSKHSPSTSLAHLAVEATRRRT